MLLKNKKISCISQNEKSKLIFYKENNRAAQLLILANQIIIHIVVYYEKIILLEYYIFKKEKIYDFYTLKSMHMFCFFYFKFNLRFISSFTCILADTYYSRDSSTIDIKFCFCLKPLFYDNQK